MQYCCLIPIRCVENKKRIYESKFQFKSVDSGAQIHYNGKNHWFTSVKLSRTNDIYVIDCQYEYCGEIENMRESLKLNIKLRHIILWVSNHNYVCENKMICIVLICHAIYSFWCICQNEDHHININVKSHIKQKLVFYGEVYNCILKDSRKRTWSLWLTAWRTLFEYIYFCKVIKIINHAKTINKLDLTLRAHSFNVLFL